MTPTTQQVAFIDAVIAGIYNISLVARAGTGKTSTILVTVDRVVAVDPELEILICAFNRPVADEISAKLIERGHTDWRKVSASTIHSMGQGLINAAFGKGVVLNKNKVRDILRQANGWGHEQRFVIDSYEGQIVALVSKAKQAGVGFFSDAPIADVAVWHAIADHFDINGLDNADDMEAIVAVAQETYKRSLTDTKSIDHDDQILFPLIKNLRVRYPKDRIFLDEAQDASRARQALIKKFIRPVTGRLYIIGDDCQAIYGFSGADAEALKNLTTSLNAIELPLTVTWRCSKAVVKLAQTIVPDIEAAANAKEGYVGNIDALPTDLKAGDAILCRTNAPLLSTAYSLIRQGIACRVEGRDIGVGLAQLAKRWKVSSIDKLLAKLDDYKEREVQKAQARDNEAKAQAVADKVDTLVVICNACIAKNQHGVADVLIAIDAIFGEKVDPKQFVTLCSMHKSKGREWERVIILTKQIKRQMQAWQAVQEKNLSYVAITRAKQTLLFLPLEG